MTRKSVTHDKNYEVLFAGYVCSSVVKHFDSRQEDRIWSFYYKWMNDWLTDWMNEWNMLHIHISSLDAESIYNKFLKDTFNVFQFCWF